MVKPLDDQNLQENQGEKPFRSRFSIFFRSLSAFIILTFLVQDLASAQGGTPLWTEVAPSRSSESGASRRSSLDKITIPDSAGLTRKAVAKGAEDVIINIQDAHSKLGAQESITEILDNLVRNYDLSLIALEGASDLVDTSLVSSFPLEEVREKTGKYLLKEGKISAGEFYSMISREPVKLYGVDDPELYKGNLDAFRALVENKLKIRAELKAMNKVLSDLEKNVYSSELLDLSDKKLLQKNGEIKFTEYWERFSKTARDNGVDYGKHKNLKKLADTVELEKEIDFKKAQKQRDSLIEELGRNLPKPELERLVLQSLQFKQGKITPGAFHYYLSRISQNSGIDPAQHKDLILYAKYVVLYEDIDLIAIFDEVESFESELREKLFKSEDERAVSALSRCVRILSQLLDTTLTDKDYAFFVKNAASCEVADIRVNLQALAAKYHVPFEGRVNFDVLSKSIPDAKEFYRLAEARNKALLENTMKRMKEENTHVAALITGGFHSEGIAKLMDSEKLSYLVVMPKFDDKSADRPYIAILTQKPKEYEKAFEDSDFYLAAQSIFSSNNEDGKFAAVAANLAGARLSVGDISEVRDKFANTLLEMGKNDWADRVRAAQVGKSEGGYTVQFTDRRYLVRFSSAGLLETISKTGGPGKELGSVDAEDLVRLQKQIDSLQEQLGMLSETVTRPIVADAQFGEWLAAAVQNGGEAHRLDGKNMAFDELTAILISFITDNLENRARRSGMALTEEHREQAAAAGARLAAEIKGVEVPETPAGSFAPRGVPAVPIALNEIPVSAPAERESASEGARLAKNSDAQWKAAIIPSLEKSNWYWPYLDERAKAVMLDRAASLRDLPTWLKRKNELGNIPWSAVALKGSAIYGPEFSLTDNNKNFPRIPEDLDVTIYTSNGQGGSYIIKLSPEDMRSLYKGWPRGPATLEIKVIPVRDVVQIGKNDNMSVRAISSLSAELILSGRDPIDRTAVPSAHSWLLKLRELNHGVSTNAQEALGLMPDDAVIEMYEKGKISDNDELRIIERKLTNLYDYELRSFKRLAEAVFSLKTFLKKYPQFHSAMPAEFITKFSPERVTELFNKWMVEGVDADFYRNHRASLKELQLAHDEYSEILNDIEAMQKPAGARMAKYFFERGEKIAGKYTVLEVLNENGGGGAVYRVENAAKEILILKTNVALGAQGDSERKEVIRGMALSMLKKEAFLLKKITDAGLTENFPRYIEDGDLEEDMSYLVMSDIGGAINGEVYLRDQRRNESLTLEISKGILKALEELQSARIVQGDVKPGNILIKTDGGVRVWVVDLGGAETDENIPLPSGMTLPPSIGDPAYRAPEQWEGKDIDFRTDVYSAALTIHRFLTDPAGKTLEIDEAYMNSRPEKSIERVQASEYSSPALKKMVLKALSVDPDDRYASIAEMRNAFEEALTPTAGARLTTVEELVENAKSGADISEEALALLEDKYRKTYGDKFDVAAWEAQKAGALVMAAGKMLEMRTGGGKANALQASALLRVVEARASAKDGKTPNGVLIGVPEALVERDYESAFETLGALGLKVGLVAKDASGKDIARLDGRDVSVEEAYKNADVLYGQIPTFVHRYNQEVLMPSASHSMLGRQYFLMADEVDQSFIYEFHVPFIVAGGRTQKNAREKNELRILSEALAKGLREGKEYRAEKRERNIVLMNEKDILRRLSDMIPDAGEDDAKTELMKELVLTNGLRYVRNALLATKFYEQDKQYVVENGEIILLDENTKAKKPGMVASNGVHQALEAKHGFPAEKMTADTYTMMTSTLKSFLESDVIRDYAGASGTIDRDFMRKVYGKETEASGTQSSAREERDATLYETRAEKESAYLERLVQIHQENGAAIVKVENDVEVRRLMKDLEEAGVPADKIQKIDANSIGDISRIERTSGRPGTITIVTNIANRGVDIKLSEAIAAKDGLIAIATYFDEFDAYEAQFQGRVGRQKDKGVWEAYYSLEDAVFEKYKTQAPEAMQLLKDISKRQKNRAASGTSGIQVERDKTDLKKAVSDLRRIIKEDFIYQAVRQDKFNTALNEKITGLLEIRDLSLETAALESREDFIQKILPKIKELVRELLEAGEQKDEKFKQFLARMGLSAEEAAHADLDEAALVSLVIAHLRQLFQSISENSLSEFITTVENERNHIQDSIRQDSFSAKQAAVDNTLEENVFLQKAFKTSERQLKADIVNAMDYVADNILENQQGEKKEEVLAETEKAPLRGKLSGWGRALAENRGRILAGFSTVAVASIIAMVGLFSGVAQAATLLSAAVMSVPLAAIAVVVLAVGLVFLTLYLKPTVLRISQVESARLRSGAYLKGGEYEGGFLKAAFNSVLLAFANFGPVFATAALIAALVAPAVGVPLMVALIAGLLSVVSSAVYIFLNKEDLASAPAHHPKSILLLGSIATKTVLALAGLTFVTAVTAGALVPFLVAALTIGSLYVFSIYTEGGSAVKHWGLRLRGVLLGLVAFAGLAGVAFLFTTGLLSAPWLLVVTAVPIILASAFAVMGNWLISRKLAEGIEGRSATATFLQNLAVNSRSVIFGFVSLLGLAPLVTVLIFGTGPVWAVAGLFLALIAAALGMAYSTIRIVTTHASAETQQNIMSVLNFVQSIAAGLPTLGLGHQVYMTQVLSVMQEAARETDPARQAALEAQLSRLFAMRDGSALNQLVDRFDRLFVIEPVVPTPSASEPVPEPAAPSQPADVEARDTREVPSRGPAPLGPPTTIGALAERTEPLIPADAQMQVEGDEALYTRDVVNVRTNWNILRATMDDPTADSPAYVIYSVEPEHLYEIIRPFAHTESSPGTTDGFNDFLRNPNTHFRQFVPPDGALGRDITRIDEWTELDADQARAANENGRAVYTLITWTDQEGVARRGVLESGSKAAAETAALRAAGNLSANVTRQTINILAVDSPSRQAELLRQQFGYTVSRPDQRIVAIRWRMDGRTRAGVEDVYYFDEVSSRVVRDDTTGAPRVMMAVVRDGQTIYLEHWPFDYEANGYVFSDARGMTAADRRNANMGGTIVFGENYLQGQLELSQLNALIAERNADDAVEYRRYNRLGTALSLFNFISPGAGAAADLIHRGVDAEGALPMGAPTEGEMAASLAEANATDVDAATTELRQMFGTRFLDNFTEFQGDRRDGAMRDHVIGAIGDVVGISGVQIDFPVGLDGNIYIPGASVPSLGGISLNGRAAVNTLERAANTDDLSLTELTFPDAPDSFQINVPLLSGILRDQSLGDVIRINNDTSQFASYSRSHLFNDEIDSVSINAFERAPIVALRTRDGLPAYGVMTDSGVRMLVLTPNGARYLEDEAREDITEYRTWMGVLEGGAIDYISGDSGTFNQRLESGLFVSYDFQDAEHHNVAYTWDNAMVGERALLSGDVEVTERILGFYTNFTREQESSDVGFRGLPSAFDANEMSAQTGQGPSIGPTAAIGNLALRYRSPDAAVNRENVFLADNIARWLKSIRNDITHAEPAAIVYSFFRNYGVSDRSNREFLRYADQLFRLARRDFWDPATGLFRAGTGDTRYSADANSRWGLAAGPEGFADTRNGLSMTPAQMDAWLQRLDDHFGVDVPYTTADGRTVTVHSVALADIADRAATGDIGMPEVAGEFEMLNLQFEQYFRSRGETALADRALERAQGYRAGIEAMRDGRGNLPSASRRDADTIFIGRTAQGRAAIAPRAQYDLTSARYNILTGSTLLGGAQLERMPVAAEISEEDATHPRVLAGEAEMLRMRQLYNDLTLRADLERRRAEGIPLTASQEAAWARLEAIPERLIDANLDTHEFTYLDAEGRRHHVVIIFTEAERRQSEERAREAVRQDAALTRARREGGVAFTTREGLPIPNTERLNARAGANELTVMLRWIATQPWQVRAELAQRNFANFEYPMDVDGDGTVETVLATLFIPSRGEFRYTAPDPDSSEETTYVSIDGVPVQRITATTITTITTDLRRGIESGTTTTRNDGTLEEPVSGAVISETRTLRAFLDAIRLGSSPATDARMVVLTINRLNGNRTIEIYGRFSTPLQTIDLDMNLVTRINHDENTGLQTSSETFRLSNGGAVRAALAINTWVEPQAGTLVSRETTVRIENRNGRRIQVARVTAANGTVKTEWRDLSASGRLIRSQSGGVTYTYTYQARFMDGQTAVRVRASNGEVWDAVRGNMGSQRVLYRVSSLAGTRYELTQPVGDSIRVIHPEGTDLYYAAERALSNRPGDRVAIRRLDMSTLSVRANGPVHSYVERAAPVRFGSESLSAINILGPDRQLIETQLFRGSVQIGFVRDGLISIRRAGRQTTLSLDRLIARSYAENRVFSGYDTYRQDGRHVGYTVDQRVSDVVDLSSTGLPASLRNVTTASAMFELTPTGNPRWIRTAFFESGNSVESGSIEPDPLYFSPDRRVLFAAETVNGVVQRRVSYDYIEQTRTAGTQRGIATRKSLSDYLNASGLARLEERDRRRLLSASVDIFEIQDLRQEKTWVALFDQEHKDAPIARLENGQLHISVFFQDLSPEEQARIRAIVPDIEPTEVVGENVYLMEGTNIVQRVAVANRNFTLEQQMAGSLAEQLRARGFTTLFDNRGNLVIFDINTLNPDENTNRTDTVGIFNNFQEIVKIDRAHNRITLNYYDSQSPWVQLGGVDYSFDINTGRMGESPVGLSVVVTPEEMLRVVPGLRPEDLEGIIPVLTLSRAGNERYFELRSRADGHTVRRISGIDLSATRPSFNQLVSEHATLMTGDRTQRESTLRNLLGRYWRPTSIITFDDSSEFENYDGRVFSAAYLRILEIYASSHTQLIDARGNISPNISSRSRLGALLFSEEGVRIEYIVHNEPGNQRFHGIDISELENDYIEVRDGDGNRLEKWYGTTSGATMEELYSNFQPTRKFYEFYGNTDTDTNGQLLETYGIATRSLVTEVDGRDEYVSSTGRGRRILENGLVVSEVQRGWTASPIARHDVARASVRDRALQYNELERQAIRGNVLASTASAYTELVDQGYLYAILTGYDRYIRPGLPGHGFPDPSASPQYIEIMGYDLDEGGGDLFHRGMIARSDMFTIRSGAANFLDRTAYMRLSSDTNQWEPLNAPIMRTWFQTVGAVETQRGPETAITYGVEDHRRGYELNITSSITPYGRLVRTEGDYAKVKVATGILGYATRGTEETYYDIFQRPVVAYEARQGEDARETLRLGHGVWETMDGRPEFTIRRESQRWTSVGAEIGADGRIRETLVFSAIEPMGPDIRHDYVQVRENGAFSPARRTDFWINAGDAVKDNWPILVIPVFLITGGLWLVGLVFDFFRIRKAEKFVQRRETEEEKPKPDDEKPEERTISAVSKEPEFVEPDYAKTYGFQSDEVAQIREKIQQVIDRQKRGEPLDAILADYFKIYSVYRKEVLGIQEPFIPTMDDLWLLQLIWFDLRELRTDASAYGLMPMLFHLSMERRDKAAEGVQPDIRSFIDEQYKVWRKILFLNISTLKGIGGQGPTSHLMPYQYFLNELDVDFMFRTPKFAQYFMQLVRGEVEGKTFKTEYEALIERFKQHTSLEKGKEGALVQKIRQIISRYNTTDKFIIRYHLQKSEEYKDYIAFFEGIQTEANPLVFKTYSDISGEKRPFLAIAHALRNIFTPVFVTFALVLFAAMAVLFWEGYLAAWVAAAYLGGGMVGLPLVKVGIDRVLKGLHTGRSVYGEPVRPDVGFEKADVSFGLKTFRVLYWFAKAAAKVAWNFMVFHFMFIASAELSGSALLLFGLVNINPALVIVLWAMFAIFFVLDTFSIGYIGGTFVTFIYGKMKGIGTIKTDRDIKKNKELLMKVLQEKLTPAELNLTPEQKKVKMAEDIETILEDMEKTGTIEADERKANSWIVKRDPDDFFKTEVKEPEKFFEFGKDDWNDVKEKNRRVRVFLNSLLMDIPAMPTIKNTRKMSILTPLGPGEDQIHIMAYLNAETDAKGVALPASAKRGTDAGLTPLSELAHKYPEHWKNFIERVRTGYTIPGVLGEDGQPEIFRASAEDIAKLEKLKRRERLGPLETEGLEMEVRIWASYRSQPFARTLKGLLRYAKVLEVLTRMNHPAMKLEDIRKIVQSKYQILVGHQDFGATLERAAEEAKNKKDQEEIDYAKERVAQTIRLLKDAYNEQGFLIDLAYLKFDKKEKVWKNVLVRLKVVGGVATDEVETVRSIDLTEDFPMIGEGKPGNQANTLGFATGEVIWTMDLNQDMNIEQAFKLPIWLQEFDPTTPIVDMPEHIFTEGFSQSAKFHAFADGTFAGGTVKRQLELHGSLFYYGHPTGIASWYADMHGGISASSFISEDLIFGMRAVMMGFKIKFVEYIEAGKGREPSWWNIVPMFSKFSLGSAQALIGRGMYYLQTSKNFGFFQKWSFFYDGLGYYVRKIPVKWAVYASLFFMVFIGVSMYSAFPVEFVMAMVGTVFFGQSITSAGWSKILMENSFLKAVVLFVLLFPLVMIFFQAHVFTYAFAFTYGLMGVAAYGVAARGFSLEHKTMREILTALTKSHLLPGVIGIAIIVPGILLWMNWTLLFSAIFMMMVVAPFIVPFGFNRGGIPFTSGVPLSTSIDLFEEDWKSGTALIGDTLNSRFYTASDPLLKGTPRAMLRIKPDDVYYKVNDPVDDKNPKISFQVRENSLDPGTYEAYNVVVKDPGNGSYSAPENFNVSFNGLKPVSIDIGEGAVKVDGTYSDPARKRSKEAGYRALDILVLGKTTNLKGETFDDIYRSEAGGIVVSHVTHTKDNDGKVKDIETQVPVLVRFDGSKPVKIVIDDVEYDIDGSYRDLGRFRNGIEYLAVFSLWAGLFGLFYGLPVLRRRLWPASKEDKRILDAKYKRDSAVATVSAFNHGTGEALFYAAYPLADYRGGNELLQSVDVVKEVIWQAFRKEGLDANAYLEFYEPDALHSTIAGVKLDFTTSLSGETIERAKEIGREVFQGSPGYRIDFDHFYASGSAVILAGFPSGKSLTRMRDALTKDHALERMDAVHMTVARFKKVPPPAVIIEINRAGMTRPPVGSVDVDKVSLVSQTGTADISHNALAVYETYALVGARLAENNIQIGPSVNIHQDIKVHPNILVNGPGSFAKGEAFIASIGPDSSLMPVQRYSKDVLNRSHDTEPLTFNDQLSGFPVSEYVRQESLGAPDYIPGVLKANSSLVELAVNSTQGHFFDRPTIIIQDGEVITKPVNRYVHAQTADYELEGVYWILSLDPGKPGVFPMRMRKGKAVGDVPVRNGFGGPLLIQRGRSTVGDLKTLGDIPQRDPSRNIALLGDEVSWASLDKRQSFTGFGYDAAGRLVITQLIGDPNDPSRPEPMVYDLVAVLRSLGVENAILGGTSGDVQRHTKVPVNGQVLRFAEPQPSSILAKLITNPRTGQRNLGTALLLVDRPIAGARLAEKAAGNRLVVEIEGTDTEFKAMEGGIEEGLGELAGAVRIVHAQNPFDPAVIENDTVRVSAVGARLSEVVGELITILHGRQQARLAAAKFMQEALSETTDDFRAIEALGARLSEISSELPKVGPTRLYLSGALFVASGAGFVDEAQQLTAYDIENALSVQGARLSNIDLLMQAFSKTVGFLMMKDAPVPFNERAKAVLSAVRQAVMNAYDAETAKIIDTPDRIRVFVNEDVHEMNPGDLVADSQYFRMKRKENGLSILSTYVAGTNSSIRNEQEAKAAGFDEYLSLPDGVDNISALDPNDAAYSRFFDRPAVLISKQGTASAMGLKAGGEPVIDLQVVKDTERLKGVFKAGVILRVNPEASIPGVEKRNGSYLIRPLIAILSEFLRRIEVETQSVGASA